MKNYITNFLLSTTILLVFATVHAQNLDKTFKLLKSKNKVLVVAHRGDWRNYPENSLKGVLSCSKMGIDIVEIDIQKTKDDSLIVMHDKTIDRTTNGKGVIKELMLDSIRKVILKSPIGIRTKQKVPTLRELMLAVKGKNIMINLDKCWDYIPEAYQILKETSTIHQAIFKGNRSVVELRGKIGNLLDSILYMPMVWPTNYNIYEPAKTESPVAFVNEYIKTYKPIAFEVIVDKETSATLETFPIMQQNGITIWVNTLWTELCAGHEDEVAVENPNKHWGWVVAQGATIIQTDNPKELLTYLRNKKLHK